MERLSKIWPLRGPNSYVLLLGICGIVSSALVYALFEIGKTSPDLIRFDYGAISAARKMKHALLGLRHPQDFVPTTTEQYVKLFDDGMNSMRQVISRRSEEFLLRQVEHEWTEARNHPNAITLEEFKVLYDALNGLVAENENEMVERVSKAQNIKTIACWGGIFFFVLAWFL